MIDFTNKIFCDLIKSFLDANYTFQTFRDYLLYPNPKTVILRHDVDLLPLNALRMAKIEYNLGIQSTYYFRVNSLVFKPDIVRYIADLEHEIGYHYEDINIAASLQGKVKWEYAGNKEEHLARAAIEMFQENLEKLNKYADVKTISMHGRPLDKLDGRLLWKYFDYKDFGLIGEPYFDVDYSKVLYLTDTGRRWDGHLVNVRDKMDGFCAEDINPFKDWIKKPIPGSLMFPTPAVIALHNRSCFHSTNDIIKAAKQNALPITIILNIHPQRWADKTIPWIKELLWQNFKNVGKYFLIKIRSKGVNV